MLLRTQLSNITLLKKSWKSVYNGKTEEKRAKSKGIDDISLKDFKENEDQYLNKISSLIKRNRYKFLPLKGYPEPKQEKNKFRLITVATVADRVVHKAILSLVNPYLYPYINTGVSYCGVKENIWSKKSNNEALTTKRAIQKIISHVANKRYHIFKSDIIKFYDSIPKRRLANLIKFLSGKYLPDHSLDTLLKDAIFFHLGNEEKFKSEKMRELLPDKYLGISQGSPLSQFFANIYLAKFDNRMKKNYGDKIIRYIDDFIVVCNSKEEALKSKEHAIKILKKYRLFLSKDGKKTYYVDLKKGALKFLGLKLDKNSITSKRNLEETRKWALETLNENNREYKDESIEEKIKSMNSKITGYGNYLKFYHVENLFDEINKQITHKMRMKKSKFIKLEMLSKKILNPIIKLSDWKALF